MSHPIRSNGAVARRPVESFCREINAIDPTELFARYERAGLLCPGKMKPLEPFWERIIHNWRKAMRLGDSLIWFLTCERDGAWGSVSSFRTTHSTWNTQHAAASGGRSASRAVLSSAARYRARPSLATVDDAQQIWFRSSNRFAKKVFGSIENALGTGCAAVETLNYVAMPKNTRDGLDSDIRVLFVEDNRSGWQHDLVQLKYATRGGVYARAEELEHDDVTLESVDEAYRRVGLRRYRRIWLAHSRARRRVVGAAVAYRGPLGLNLGFLENRCDLLTLPGLSKDRARRVVNRLLAAASRAYQDFEPDFIPVVTDPSTAARLVTCGGQRIRQYAQASFLRSAYADWHRHVERTHARRLTRAERRTSTTEAAAA